MKTLYTIMLSSLLLLGCEEKPDNLAKTKKIISDFNLKTDMTNFKKKMSEGDTIKIWFDHSVCSYRGAERIEITKESNHIKIKTDFKEETLNQEPTWQLIYEKQIPINDTLWKIEEFFTRHNNRKESKEKEYGTLQVSHNTSTEHYFTKGLVDLNVFMADFFDTMRVLHPENTNDIYGIEIAEILSKDGY